MIDTSRKKETAVLIGIVTGDQDPGKVNEYLDELAFLVDTAGGIPSGRFIQKLGIPDAKSYVGKGKLYEIRECIGTR